MNFVLIKFVIISLFIDMSASADKSIFHTFGKFLFPQSTIKEKVLYQVPKQDPVGVNRGFFWPGDHYEHGSLSSYLNKYYGYDCSTALSLIATIGYLIYLSLILPQTVRDVGHLFGSRSEATTTTANSIDPYRKKRSLELGENIIKIPIDCWEREFCSINEKILQKFQPEISTFMDLYKPSLDSKFSWPNCGNLKETRKFCKPFDGLKKGFLSKFFENIEKF